MNFTYFIKWSNTGMMYYGARWAKNANLDSICTTYFTSSKIVHNYIKKHGLPDVVKIRRVFDKPQQAKDWEYKFLQRLDVQHRKDFLNANQTQAAPTVSFIGKANPATRLEVREKIKNNHADCSGSLNGRSLLTEDQVAYIRKFHKENNITYGKLAKMYNVSYNTMRNAIVGYSWTHID